MTSNSASQLSGDTPVHVKNDVNNRKTSPQKSHAALNTTETPYGPKTEISRLSNETASLLETEYGADVQSELVPPGQGGDLTGCHNKPAQSAAQGDLTGPTPNGQNSSSPASANSHIRGSNLTPPRSRTKEAKPRPKLMLNSNITKQPMSADTRPNPVTSKQVTLRKDTSWKRPSFTSQPSEEDLFYMLIRRLKKRDEMEAEAVAIKKRMEGKMLELTRANDDLSCKLQESEIICKNQQEQLNARNSIIERWKVKFNRLRAFVTNVGNDFEVLRKEGQILRSTQDSLLREKEEINETLKQMSDSTDLLKTRWSQQCATITGARLEFDNLEKSLLTATSTVTETEKLLSRERNRVATLENYVKNYSDNHRKQTAELDEKQFQTITKLDAIHKQLECWNFSQSSIKGEMESGFSSCMSLLNSLSQQQSVKPQDLDKVDSAIRDLATQLNLSIEAWKKHMETAFDMHTNYGPRLSTQLTGIESAVNSNAGAVCQLAEVRELYGGLQEKLNAAERSLAEVSADRDKVKSQGESLQRHIRDLELEISSLQKNEIDETHFKDAGMLSDLRIQLEATSAALTEVTKELKTKESEMRDMKQKLRETIEKLGTAEIEIVDLKSKSLRIRDEAQKTEHKVREELTRANLAAKDQHRAWFEQEQHKLQREKIVAEKNAQKASEELNSVKCSLQSAEKYNLDLIAKMNEQQSEIDSLKMTVSKRDSDISTEMNEIKMLHTSTIQELQDAQGQLDVAANEKEELKHKLSELRTSLVILQEHEPLQEALEALQYEIAEKDINLLSLKEELSKSEANNKRISQFQQELVDKSAEIAILRERLDNQLASNCSMEESLREKNNELVILKKKMEACGEFSADTSTLNGDVEQRNNELADLRSRIQAAEHIFEYAESILKQLGIIGIEESLRGCSNELQSRLRMMAGSLEERQPEELTESLHIPMRTSSKRQRTGRKCTMSSTYAERTGPGSSTRESQTTELVYRTRSTRETTSPTLKTPSRRKNVSKRCPTALTSFIRPFSQFQKDSTPYLGQREQTSPLSEFTDLNILFPSTPMNSENVGSDRTPNIATQGSTYSNKAMLPHEVGTTNERITPSISNSVNDVMCMSGLDKDCKQPGDPIVQKSPCEAIRGGPAPVASTPNRRGHVKNACSKNSPCSPLKTRSSTLKRKEIPEDETHTMVAKSVGRKHAEKPPRKGILKGTTKPNASTVASAVQTPPHATNGEDPMGASPKITFRCPSRKSKYFNPTTSPVASITARRGRCGSTAKMLSAPAGRTRERPRRKQRALDVNLNR
ncbi:predicted protein [Histoplasma capsulatum G186AR]|uniref:Rootletin n=1 Tax=Ajellomyces capsulatus (strain G186AR / H82 / ATCC MYA-2454 / RMSCC 2432) TaxID=447093 RepID=C0NS41_AJECG|nr:uncharacterized protein HCBG_05971 [Histoplasma capsulatum G186AR]EEH05707.1 predicted protein [Histoplasma capsulatum G186AR]